MEEGKKISFGFMKTKKLEKLPVLEKKDFIECVEEKAIKVVGGDEVKEVAPLVIPMKPNTLITTERLKEIAVKVESALEEPDSKEELAKTMEVVPENETLDQMAVREILEDSKKSVQLDVPKLNLILPAKSMSSGEKESSLDDYESVPIQEFGLAMLRGMGWTKGNETSTFKQPPLRPKGLGLGADKVVKDNNKQKASKNSKEEDLSIIKNAFVKITSGKYRGYYGKVLSLDEDNGRVMVDITVKKETVSLSEFMMHPVTKSEFDKESKVINAIFEELSFATNPISFVKESNPSKDSNSYDQYKKKEEQRQTRNEKESKSLDRNNRDEKEKHGRASSSRENNNQRRTEKDSKSEHANSRERNRDRSSREKIRHSSVEKKSKTKKRYSSNDSLSNSDSERNKRGGNSKKRYSSLESLDSADVRQKERKRRDDSESGSRRNNKDRQRYDSDLEHKSGKNGNKERKRDDSELTRKSKKDEDRKRYDSETEQKSNRDKERKRYDSDSEPEQRKNKKKKERRRHDSSPESDRVSKNNQARKRHDSDSEVEQGRSKKEKEKRYDSDSESDHRNSRKSSPDRKRDIDKKRKGKKKKRDRDRSPNYKKHRK